MIARIEAHLTERVRIGRYWTLLAGLLFIATSFAFNNPVPHPPGTRIHHLAVLGYVIPEAVLDHPVYWWTAWLMMAGGAVTWLAGRGLRVAPIVTLVGMLLVYTHDVEHMFYTRHQGFMPTQIGFVLAAWTLIDRKRIAEAIARGTVWQDTLLPRWVEYATLGYMGWHYTVSGISKIATSGIGWANAESLQLWMARFGFGPVGAFIAETPWFAGMGMAIVLFLETFGILGLPWKVSRPVFGFGLLVFHLSLEITLNLGFYANEWSLIILTMPLFKDTPESA
ncbi:MAG: hypothetical protein EP330_15680 [Deltaproteobacteria bacterium]|nr:MAG: hypothetical protein EP330_15680 [Deltaproteobacteria bacterium]